MLRSFKNLELLRYYVSSSIEKNFREISRKNEKDSKQLSSTVFSTTFSMIATFVSTKYMDEIPTMQNVNLMIIVFSLGYLASYLIFNVALKGFDCFKYSVKKYGAKNSPEKIKQLIDDFDHIACDNVLIAKEFMRHYIHERRRRDNKAATFAYYEALYYLKSASDKVGNVLNNENQCINKSVGSLDIYRVDNLFSMMEDIRDFIYTNRCKITISSELEIELDTQIDNVNEKLNEIKIQIEKYKK